MIIPRGVRPELHEFNAADVFLKLGKDVEFIKPSGTKNAKSPDVLVDGKEWEIKSALGNSRYTVEKQLKRAAHQSQNLIFDSRRTKLSTDYLKKEIARQLSQKTSIRAVKLITKSGKVVDFVK